MADVWPTVPGSSDTEKASNCCSVCAERGTLLDDVVENDREVDEEEDDEDGKVFEKEKDYENVIDQYYELGYVHNPEILLS